MRDLVLLSVNMQKPIGHWHQGDPDILIVFDSGYDLTRLAWLLQDLPVEVAGRLRSDQVMYFPAPPREPGANGRPSRHGAAQATAWGRLHQRLAGRAGWEDHDGELPVIEGTLIRLAVGHLPGDRSPEPLWLWSSRAGPDSIAVDRTWQAFLRRFDLEDAARTGQRTETRQTRPRTPARISQPRARYPP